MLSLGRLTWNMSAHLHIVHPNAEARQHLIATLSSEDYVVHSSDHLSLLSASRFNESPPDLLLISACSADSVDTLLNWAKNSVQATTRLILLIDKTRQHQLQPWLGYQLDEYLLEPLDSVEVLTRVSAALTRAPVASRERLTRGPIEYDVAAHIVLVNGVPLDLAPTEFRLITFLLRHPGRVFSRSELLHHAWGDKVKAGERTVDVHIRRLRQLLERFHCDDMISTVRGFGYRFTDMSSFEPTSRRRELQPLTGASLDR